MKTSRESQKILCSFMHLPKTEIFHTELHGPASEIESIVLEVDDRHFAISTFIHSGSDW